MNFKKKDLEIVYSLRWKNGSKREDKKQMSIVAVYDIPTTTLNFEVFKSYLLKNSGTAEDDVNVFFITDHGKEYPIQSQTDFQVALYAFRRKARAGEVINLLLERISDQPTHKNVRRSNDVETQFDNVEQASIVSSFCNADMPPDWFIAGLAQLKKELKEEIASHVSSVVANAVAELKPPVPSAPPQHVVCPHRVRVKPEKRLRKLISHGADTASESKSLMKSLKLENKLEKLEIKASKYREKRLALQHGQKSSDNGPKSSDSEAGRSSSRSRSRDKEQKRKEKEEQLKRKTEEQQQLKSTEEPKMDAQPVKVQTSIPHMLGGEIYMHQWEVKNTGEAQWTSSTSLQYTWGSKQLVPVEKVIPVPYLKPGEKGTISVRLQIPTQAGKYECYWQFVHRARRFGHWLGVQVVVDCFDLKGHSSVLEKTSAFDLDCYPRRGSTAEEYEIENGKSVEALASIYKSLQGDKQADKTSGDSVKKVTEQLVKGISENLDLQLSRISSSGILNEDAEVYELNVEDIDSDCSWSSGQFWSKDEKDEFVVVPVPQCFVLDTPESSDNKLVKKETKPIKEEKSDHTEAGPSTSAAQTSDSQGQKADANDSSLDKNNNTESVSASPGGSIKLTDEELDNIVVITVPKDEQVRQGYIYVHFDGQKVLIPKMFLKSEVVNAAQELEKSPSAAKTVGLVISSNETLNKSPTPSQASTITGQNPVQPKTKHDKTNSGNILDSEPPKTLEAPIIPQQDNVAVDLSTASRETAEYPLDEGVDKSNYFEANNYMSHCSAAGSCFSEVNTQSERQNRVFVFPQDVPGYEIIYPVLDMNNPEMHGHQNLQPTCPTSVPFNIPEGQLPNPFVEPVANFQQTPPEMRRTYRQPSQEASTKSGSSPFVDTQQQSSEGVNQQARTNNGTQDNSKGSVTEVHILPETLVSGAVNVASSAINHVINMIKPQAPGRWVNGHWVSSNPETPREANLQALAEMGFWNRDLNATLLARFDDDLNRVVAELVQ